MKKLILIIILFFNLIPYINHQHLVVGPESVLAQNPGGEGEEEAAPEDSVATPDDFHLVDIVSEANWDEYTNLAADHGYTTGPESDVEDYVNDTSDEIMVVGTNTVISGNGESYNYFNATYAGDILFPLGYYVAAYYKPHERKHRKVDCAGVEGGTAENQWCGCVLGTTGLPDCGPTNDFPDNADCNGDANGTAYMASCGCIGGNTGKTSCPPDDGGGGVQNGDTNGTLPPGSGNIGTTPPSGGGNSGGTTPPNNPPTNNPPPNNPPPNNPPPNTTPPPEPCSQTAKDKGADAEKLSNSLDIKNGMDTLRNEAANAGPEKGFAIYKNDTTGSYSNDNTTQGASSTASTVTFNPKTGTTPEGMAHNHKSDRGPSAADLFALEEANSQYQTNTVSLVESRDNNEYAYVVTDQAAFDAFKTSYSKGGSVDLDPASDDYNSFLKGSTLGDPYAIAYINIYNGIISGYPGTPPPAYVTQAQVDAQNGATAYILQTFKSGITLYQKNKTTGKFTPISTTKTPKDGIFGYDYTTSPCN